MEKPFFLIMSTSEKTGYLFDRRVKTDKDTLPMRERLLNIGCTIKEISQTECDNLLKEDKDWYIF